MIRYALNKFNIVLLILFLTSCAKINVVKLDQDLLRVDKFDKKDQFIKSYYKKFDQETSQWLPVICNYDGANILNLKSNECEFTDMSLHMIRIAKESDNIVGSSTLSNNENNKVKEKDNKEQQDNGNEESGSFMFCGGEDCNN